MSKITLTVRKVHKDPASNYYRVMENRGGDTWYVVSKSYRHSTSAFAALGRLVQKDTFKQLYS